MGCGCVILYLWLTDIFEVTRRRTASSALAGMGVATDLTVWFEFAKYRPNLQTSSTVSKNIRANATFPVAVNFLPHFARLAPGTSD